MMARNININVNSYKKTMHRVMIEIFTIEFLTRHNPLNPTTKVSSGNKTKRQFVRNQYHCHWILKMIRQNKLFNPSVKYPIVLVLPFPYKIIMHIAYPTACYPTACYPTACYPTACYYQSVRCAITIEKNILSGGYVVCLGGFPLLNYLNL